MSTSTPLEWRTSSHSGAGENCVQIAPTAGWRTSRHTSNGEACVEVAPTIDSTDSSTNNLATTTGENLVYLRHSKHPTAGTFTFDPDTWTRFIADTRRGTHNPNSVVTVREDGTDTLLNSPDGTTELRFNHAEWTAFTAGARDGEFDF